MATDASGTGENAIVTLRELELAAGLLADPFAAARFKDPPRWRAFGERIAAAMDAGHRFLVIAPHAEGWELERCWRIPLGDLDAASRARVTAALDFYARRYGRPFRPERVEYLI